MEILTSLARRAYDNYLESFSLDGNGLETPLNVGDFIEKLKLDDVFYEKWGDCCAEELTEEERYSIWFTRNYETGMEYNPNIIPNFEDPNYEPTPKRKLKVTLSEKYLDFILDNVISKSIKVNLPRPMEDGKTFWVKLGPIVTIDVKLEVLEKYSRSAKFKVMFDCYEIERVFHIPLESAPTAIRDKLYHKLSNLVYNTFIENGRRDEISKMHEDKHKLMFEQIKISTEFTNKINKDKN